MLDLEPRFQKPEGFEISKIRRGNRSLRLGSLIPEKPDAVIVVLPGLSEFIEKYYETVRNLNAHNHAVFVVDWMGQGGGGRYLVNSHKRHGTDFAEDVNDLDEIMREHIMPAVSKAGKDLPLIMLGHSMGGNIGLHYLARHPETFLCAGFSAPMIGIQNLPLAMLPIAYSLHYLSGESYAFGQQNWTHSLRENAGRDQFSSDPERGAVHNAWCLAQPDLQVGGVTFSWAYYALKACADIQAKLPAIQTPCLLAQAEKEQIVDNTAIARAAEKLPHAKLITAKDAQHEILMERDAPRDTFLKEFYVLIKESMMGTNQ